MRDAGRDVLAFAAADACCFFCHLTRAFRSLRRRNSSGYTFGEIDRGEDYFFLPWIGLALPLRVRALVWVRWPRTGSWRRWRRPR